MSGIDPASNGLTARRGARLTLQKLILLACLPSLGVALIAMVMAGLSPYLIGFIALVLILIIVHCVVSGAYHSDYQIRTLSNLIEAMIDGDYTLRGRVQSNPAFEELLVLINQLADTLQRHRLAAEESQLLLDKIMEQMDAMVFAINPDHRIEMQNGSARKLLFRNQPVDQPLDWQASGLAVLRDVQQSGVVTLDAKELKGEFFLFKDRFISDNQEHDLYLLTRADRLLREKEREAWQNLLRVLGHEVNNSLTPIATFSRSMLRKLHNKPGHETIETFEEGLTIIRERAESLSAFINSYSELSRLPAPQKTPVDWYQRLLRLADLIPGCSTTSHVVDSSIKTTPVFADPQQLDQVFINLLRNASESMASVATKTIELDAQREQNWLHVMIRDRGVGIANESNLFVPFYTTKASGSGIGLVLCRQIVMNHDGHLSIRNREDGDGAEAIVSLPLLGPAQATQPLTD